MTYRMGHSKSGFLSSSIYAKLTMDSDMFVGTAVYSVKEKYHPWKPIPEM